MFQYDSIVGGERKRSGQDFMCVEGDVKAGAVNADLYMRVEQKVHERGFLRVRIVSA